MSELRVETAQSTSTDQKRNETTEVKNLPAVSEESTGQTIAHKLFESNPAAFDMLSPYLLGEVSFEAGTDLAADMRLLAKATLEQLIVDSALASEALQPGLRLVGLAAPEGQDFLPITSTGIYDTMTRELSAA